MPISPTGRLGKRWRERAESAVYLIVSTPCTLAFWLVRRAGPARSERRDRRGWAEKEQTTQERQASARKTWICPPWPPQFNRSGGKSGKVWQALEGLASFVWEATGTGSWTSREIVPLKRHSLSRFFCPVAPFFPFCPLQFSILLHLISARAALFFLLRSTYLVI